MHKLVDTLKICVVLLFLGNLSFAQKYKYDENARDEGAQMVENQMGLIENPLTLEYLRGIGQRLVDQLENRTFEYEFFIVDMMEPNAFSLPGGYIYISRGLLILINDEAELAGIIGHEIIHAHNRHSYRRRRRPSRTRSSCALPRRGSSRSSRSRIRCNRRACWASCISTFPKRQQ